MAKAPVAAGERHELNIQSMTSQGQGVARVDGYAVFVPDTLPGERVRAKIESIGARFARGRLLDVLEPSAHRITPRCPHFGVCGGCQLQHLSYPEQVKQKTLWVSDALSRIGSIDFPVSDCLPSPLEWEYRNNAQFAFANAPGGVVGGYRRAGSHEVVPIRVCLIQHPAAPEALSRALGWANDFSLRALDDSNPNGLLRHLIVRTNREGHVLIILVASAGRIPRERELVERLLQIPGLAGVALHVQPRPDGPVAGAPAAVLWGEGSLHESLNGVRMRVSSASFFQVNTLQAEAMFRYAADIAMAEPPASALDAYCGAGALTLQFARRGIPVVGVESFEDAVRDARENALANGIDNASFLAAPAEDALPDLLAEHRPQLVSLDPPRAGCDPAVLDALAKARTPRILYVSCDPATLARDLRILAAHNYRPLSIQPFDMFPHTAHVETVVLITRVEK